MESLRSFVTSSIQTLTKGSPLDGFLESLIILAFVLLIVFLMDLLGTVIVRHILPKLTTRIRIFRSSGAHMDHKIALKIVRICTVQVFKSLFPLVLLPDAYPWVLVLVQSLCRIYQTLLIAQLIGLLLDLSRRHLLSREATRNHPFINVTQVVKILVYCVAMIVVVSILFSIRVKDVFTSLAAASAVLMLIFKDTILGFVAGIQLLSNDMVRVGDWITMNKYGADGDVVDITLNTVKVRNFDKTITTIPPYALLSESFQNWRGMEESGGRRIKKEIILDAQTVVPVDEEWKELIRHRGLHPESLEAALRDRNIDADFGTSSLPLEQPYVMTNSGVYRRYIYEYLKACSAVHPHFPCIIRQLPVTANGVPVQLYFFSSTTTWTEYESIQSNLTEYFISIVPLFGLKIYQRLTNKDSSSREL